MDARRHLGLPLPQGGDDTLWGKVKVLSAIIPARPSTCGIWRSQGAGRTSMIRVFAPGPTWFLSIPATAGRDADIRAAVQNCRFADASLAPAGFGYMLAGEWPTREELQKRMQP